MEFGVVFAINIFQVKDTDNLTSEKLLPTPQEVSRFEQIYEGQTCHLSIARIIMATEYYCDLVRTSMNTPV